VSHLHWHRGDLGFVASSRGCPYDCIFCSNRITTGKRYRFRSNESIIATLKLLYEKYNRTFVLFLDDNFLVNKERVYDLIDMIMSEGLHHKMTFSFQARGDNVDRQLLSSLYSAGFKSVFFGLETASEALMKIVKKGETVQQCIHAVQLAREIGFHVSATFIFGLPTETHQDRLDAILLAKELMLDQVRFNNATPYPGTELYQIAKSQDRLKIYGVYENFLSVGTFIENPFSPIPFSYTPPGNTEAEIRNDILFAYLSFYWDFRKIKEILFKPKQGVGWFSAGSNWVAFLKKIPSLVLLFFLAGYKFFKMVLDILLQRNTQLPRRYLWRALTGRPITGSSGPIVNLTK